MVAFTMSSWSTMAAWCLVVWLGGGFACGVFGRDGQLVAVGGLSWGNNAFRHRAWFRSCRCRLPSCSTLQLRGGEGHGPEAAEEERVGEGEALGGICEGWPVRTNVHGKLNHLGEPVVATGRQLPSGADTPMWIVKPPGAQILPLRACSLGRTAR